MKKQPIRRAIAFCLSILLLVSIFMVVISKYYHKPIKDNVVELVYYNSDSRNSSKTALKAVFEENGIPVFGSSELSSVFGRAYPKILFNNGNSDFNMVMIGRGTMQSLHHAINVGALSDCIPSKKIIFILSPQWFTKTHLGSDAYASRFIERMFVSAITNPNLSYKTKRRIADRAESYLKDGDPIEYERVVKYDKVYIEKDFNPAVWIYLKTWDATQNIRADKDVITSSIKGNVDVDPKAKVTMGSIDFAALLAEMEEEGEQSCTNNELYIEDSYYTTYIEKDLNAYQGYNSGLSYLDSPEYDDLDLFLTVCKETGVEPLVVSIPLTGFWSDYTGFPQTERSAYYQKIRDICREHNVSIMDFSDREYEPFFLKDIMHLGWKGWVYLDEAAYRFSLSNDTVIEYPFSVHGIIYYQQDHRLLTLDTHLSDVNEAELRIGENVISLNENTLGFLEADVTEYNSDLFNETAELYINGKHGAGLTAKVPINNLQELIQDDGSMSAGTKKTGKKGYVFSTETEDNRFSYVVFQIHQNDEFIMNFGQSTAIGTNEGTYYHSLPTGDYTLVFRANSNKADETVSWNVYLEEGKHYFFEYNVDIFQSQFVETSFVRFWSVNKYEE